jgi:hypothetical protein
LDSLQTPPATPGNRSSATTKSPWVRRAIRCLKATWWGYRLWDLGHKLVAYFMDPESWGGKLLASLMDPDPWWKDLL